MESEKIAFIVDAMLGRLARWLRILGFDTRYISDISDDVLLGIALKEKRILLTRDRGLIVRARKLGIEVMEVPDKNIEEKLCFVLQTLRIHPDTYAMWTRCIECNAILVSIPREHVRKIVPKFVYEHHTSFYQCPDCKKIYWEGTHFKKMKRILEKLRKVHIQDI